MQQLLGTARFPDGVQMLLGSYPKLFGTALGLRLQRLCQRWGWPLIWARAAFDAQGEACGTSTGHDCRLLDPSTAGGTSTGGSNISTVGANLTALRPNSTVGAAFATHWETVERTRASGGWGEGGSSVVAKHWGALASAMTGELSLEPLRTGRCEGKGGDVGNCIGTNRLNDCVCKQ